MTAVFLLKRIRKISELLRFFGPGNNRFEFGRVGKGKEGEKAGPKIEEVLNNLL